ncbi:unnamed protein product [Acanthoscelides obtectus]|uniref:Uncharacterized protein n=1 Tax=Acanthoscelides obtectus TaxID=200917 RepID=A0A9P0MFT9_ACAOB|nr:unnamed protein product [Acanthoscelides obtectus]CAK1642506.1 hypothetical protein AOBTE_LOCUS13076 [Acanthoscelides obtectus]
MEPREKPYPTSSSARRPEIFLLFCLRIVEGNFIDNFLGHSC